MTLRDELIQVAAVAVAIVEDLDNGSALGNHTDNVTEEVYEERVRQNLKWGAQHHNPAIWLAILAEEVGEVASAVGDETGYNGPASTLIGMLNDAEGIARSMLIHYGADS